VVPSGRVFKTEGGEDTAAAGVAMTVFAAVGALVAAAVGEGVAVGVAVGACVAVTVGAGVAVSAGVSVGEIWAIWVAVIWAGVAPWVTAEAELNSIKLAFTLATIISKSNKSASNTNSRRRFLVRTGGIGMVVWFSSGMT
jgi:hypothetical protein